MTPKYIFVHNQYSDYDLILLNYDIIIILIINENYLLSYVYPLSLKIIFKRNFLHPVRFYHVNQY